MEIGLGLLYVNLCLFLNLGENYDNKPRSHTHFFLQCHDRCGKLEFWDDVIPVARRTNVGNLSNSYTFKASQ